MRAAAGELSASLSARPSAPGRQLVVSAAPQALCLELVIQGTMRLIDLASMVPLIQRRDRLAHRLEQVQVVWENWPEGRGA